jgi:hypothetical protein
MEVGRDDAVICRDRALMAVAAERDLGKAQAMWLLARTFNRRMKLERSASGESDAALRTRGDAGGSSIARELKG